MGNYNIFQCCYKCTKDRNNGLCHSTCPEYLQALEENEKRKEYDRFNKAPILTKGIFLGNAIHHNPVKHKSEW